MSVANAVRAGAPRPEDSGGAHDSTRGCLDSRRVERFIPAIIRHGELLLEGNARFLGDVAQSFSDRQNQSDAIFAAPSFCVAFKVAGQERPGGAGTGVGSAQAAGVIAKLALEGATIA